MENQGSGVSGPEVIDLQSELCELAYGGGKRSWYFDRFFVILRTPDQLSKTKLANLFVEVFWEDFGCRCVLHTPDGRQIAVKVLKESKTNGEKRIYLTEGWSSFCRGYGLGVGTFAVSQYFGRAHFDLLLFDLSSTDIGYSYMPPSVPLINEVKREVSFEAGRGAGSPSVVGGGERLSLGGKRNGGSKLSRSSPASTSHTLGKPSHSVGKLKKCVKSGLPSASFRIVVSRASLARNGQIWIPKEHSCVYLARLKAQTVTLVYSGSSFAVTFSKTSKGYRIGKGWDDFARACSIHVGDNLKFDLVDKVGFVYDVSAC